MKFIEKLFSLLKIVVISSIVIPLILGLFLLLGNQTKGFAIAMLNASMIGVINYIALTYLKKWVMGEESKC